MPVVVTKFYHFKITSEDVSSMVTVALSFSVLSRAIRAFSLDGPFDNFYFSPWKRM